MTHSQLEASVISTLQMYWRIKAALAIYQEYSAHEDLGIRVIDYASVPQIGFATSFLTNETVSEATAAVADYVQNRLSGDLFLAMIAHFEAFLIAIIVRGGGAASGTLGQLQHAVQALHTIPQPIVEDFDEVRERRNVLIHSHGQINARYRSAAINVFARSHGFVPDPTTIVSIGIPADYLSYVADVVVRYSKALP